ncbi:MAG: efflux RND transporter periplasmic adaptor subunit [Candidatus Binatia bacterium]
MSAREDTPVAPGWRRLLWVLPALVALGLIPMWCGRSPAPTVQTVVVKRAPLRVVVATNGKVEPVDDIEVRARLDGRIVAIPDAGKVVQADEELVRFDAGLVAAQLASAESERLAAVESLRAARAQAAEARARVATDATLFKEGALTRDAYTVSERAAVEADAHLAYLERDVPLRVASLESRIKELRSQRDATAVRAPFGGTVYKTQVKKGAMVRLGDLLLQIADLEHLRVRANIDQVDLGRVQPGQPVRVSANAFPGRTWSGVMTEIVPNVVVKESRSVAEALARLEPPMDGLVPGMTVDVEIVVAEAADALQVPADAVTTQAGASTVYRLDGNRVRILPVQLGLTSVTASQITSGLAEGDLVVIGPVEALHDGMRVEAMPNAPAAG